ncbi:carboxylesterase family protein [Elizabethkingia meningoseptica]|uniref:carboxylesterase family protein n=1 Tax=Elizabethkingia meningoseptica TaxID=238 RepID=UPI002010CE35|nr:prolyl oligopeptidase family serine peptidase [Elizabethkingia meningoseptica]MCL1675718.1 alpha/beta hydrolase-fold protein [Elizabethkingia meningoseptica]MCL1686866.1 alpha/beta hydrolase-fold protein [Elizabethkingia meningoseptica]
MIKKLSFVLILFWSCFLLAQDFFLFKKFKFTQDEQAMPYRILLPKNYDPGKSYPLVMFLHGRGESGADNEKQLTHGAQLFLNENNRDNFPAIVVFPQCPENSYWSNVQMIYDEQGKRTFYFTNGGAQTKAMTLLSGLLGNLQQQYKIKQDQIYIMGLSMGGMGTFELVNRMPNVFAGAIAICGGADPSTVSNLKDTGWWVFHGGKDDVVPSRFSDSMVKTMRAKGVKVKYTFYPEANHNSWDSAFAEPDLLKWLFSQHR